jgi:hypothetical protein
MPTTVTCYDETTGGERTPAVKIDLPSSKTTVREIITARVYQEVQDYNLRQGEVFQGLVMPSDAEQALNGYKMKKPKFIKWETQVKKAIEAFQSNGFFVMIDDNQHNQLDAEVMVGPETGVSFIKLVLLVGG